MANNYYQKKENDKKCKYACEQYRNLSGEEKEKKRQYGRERYKNPLEDEIARNKDYLSIKLFLLYLP